MSAEWNAERFIAAKMANLCWAIAHDQTMPVDIRTTARECYLQFDGLKAPSLNNPILAAQLESKFFPKGER